MWTKKPSFCAFLRLTTYWTIRLLNTCWTRYSQALRHTHTCTQSHFSLEYIHTHTSATKLLPYLSCFFPNFPFRPFISMHSSPFPYCSPFPSLPYNRTLSPLAPCPPLLSPPAYYPPPLLSPPRVS